MQVVFLAHVVHEQFVQLAFGWRFFRHFNLGLERVADFFHERGFGFVGFGFGAAAEGFGDGVGVERSTQELARVFGFAVRRGDAVDAREFAGVGFGGAMFFVCDREHVALLAGAAGVAATFADFRHAGAFEDGAEGGAVVFVFLQFGVDFAAAERFDRDFADVFAAHFVAEDAAGLRVLSDVFVKSDAFGGFKRLLGEFVKAPRTGGHQFEVRFRRAVAIVALHFARAVFRFGVVGDFHVFGVIEFDRRAVVAFVGRVAGFFAQRAPIGMAACETGDA